MGNGGLMYYAFQFYESTSVASEQSYAYTGRDGTCKSSYTAAIPEGGVTGFKDISSESALLDAVANTGPVSVAIEADQMSFQMYSGGVLTGSCGTNLDHGVLAVGYGSESGTDYWKVKNSWGASWGANGYVLIQRGVNKCGIADGPPSYPTVSGSPGPAPTPTPTPTPGSHHHYEAPPCLDDEIAGDLEGGGQLCAAECDASGRCLRVPRWLCSERRAHADEDFRHCVSKSFSVLAALMMRTRPFAAKPSPLASVICSPIPACRLAAAVMPV